MAAADEIAIKLGIKTGDLKAALADANVSIKQFKKEGESGGSAFEQSMKAAKKGIETFKQVLAGAGVIQLLRGLSDAAVKFAEDYKGAFDADVAATLRLKESHQDLGSVLQNVTGRIGVSLVGAMEKFGVAVGAMVYGTDAASDALNKLDAESKKAFDDAKAKKFNEETAKLGKLIRDNAVAQADANGKVNLLAADFVKLLQEQSKLQKGSIEYVQKQIEVETKRGDLQKADAEARKKDEDDRKKAADEAMQKEKAFQDDRARNFEQLGELYEKERDMRNESLTLSERQNKLLSEERDLADELNDLEEGTVEYNQAYARILEVRSKFRKSEEEAGKVNLEVAKLLLIPEGQRTDLQKEQLKLLTGETTEHKQQLELQGLLKIGVENLTTAELARLKVLMGQTVEIKAQGDEQARQRQAQEEFLKHSLSQKGDVRNLSDVQLDALKLKLQKQIDDIAREDKKVQGPGTIVGFYTSLEQNLAKQNLAQVQSEISARLQFQRTAGFLGGTFNERNYAPDEFARLSQLFNPDQQRRDSQNLSTVALGLQSMFPDKFTGAIR